MKTPVFLRRGGAEENLAAKIGHRGRGEAGGGGGAQVARARGARDRGVSSTEIPADPRPESGGRGGAQRKGACSTRILEGAQALLVEPGHSAFPPRRSFVRGIEIGAMARA
jgi:hypothetical protein